MKGKFQNAFEPKITLFLSVFIFRSECIPENTNKYKDLLVNWSWAITNFKNIAQKKYLFLLPLLGKGFTSI
jgi:hypothetical protein